MYTILRTTVATLILTLTSLTLQAHPIHVSVVNLEYLPDSNRIDFSVQLCADDLEKIINYEYHTLLTFHNRSRLTTQEQDALERYIQANFSIQAKGILPSRLHSWGLDEGQVRLYFSCLSPLTVDSLVVSNTFMITYFPDQVNLLISHFKNTETGVEFNKGTTLQTIVFK